MEIVKNALGKETTPSWVGYEANGRIIVGQNARDCPTWIYDGKRMIGKPFHDTDIQEFNQNVWAFEVSEGDNDRCLISVPGRPDPVSMEEISGNVLKAMKKAVDDMYGCDAKKAVVTVPAYFTDS